VSFLYHQSKNHFQVQAFFNNNDGSDINRRKMTDME
jgi:hypothetical protein